MTDKCYLLLRHISNDNKSNFYSDHKSQYEKVFSREYELRNIGGMNKIRKPQLCDTVK